jgi:hypothetical protein
MRLAATLGITIVLLVLVVQLVFDGTGPLGTGLGDALVLAVLAGGAWLVTLFARAGPSGLLAFLLLFGSLATFGYASAISAALFILAITLGIYGYLGEQAMRHDEADKQYVNSPN